MLFQELSHNLGDFSMKRQPLWEFPQYIADFTAAIPNDPKGSRGYRRRKCDNIYG